MGVLCDYFVQLFMYFVDYRWCVFFAKLLQKPLGMPTHLWLSSFTASFCWPSFPWTAISRWLVFSVVRCRLHFLVSFVNSRLSSLGSSFPSPLPVSRESRVQALSLGFTLKQTKRSSAWRTTHIVSQADKRCA